MLDDLRRVASGAGGGGGGGGGTAGGLGGWGLPSSPCLGGAAPASAASLASFSSSSVCMAKGLAAAEGASVPVSSWGVGSGGWFEEVGEVSGARCGGSVSGAGFLSFFSSLVSGPGSPRGVEVGGGLGGVVGASGAGGGGVPLGAGVSSGGVGLMLVGGGGRAGSVVCFALSMLLGGRLGVVGVIGDGGEVLVSCFPSSTSMISGSESVL